MNKLRLLDLFSGIGGFSLGLERSGFFETVAFCEIEPFPRRVLAKHWPQVPIYDDVRTLTADRLAADGIAVDAICGGFPCQDISFAGKGAGLAGERSGLWFEYARIIGELGPEYVIVENVGALLFRGLDAVLGTLDSIGYDAEWHCIPASSVGAPHRRDRLWVVANAKSERRGKERELRRGEPSQRPAGRGEALANSKNYWPGWREQFSESSESSGNVANAGFQRLPLAGKVPDGNDWFEGGGMLATSTWWATEPDVGRVAHGVPSRVDRLKGLGNAVVPQVVELIGRAIGASMLEKHEPRIRAAFGTEARAS